jgi:hypothetical protein
MQSQKILFMNEMKQYEICPRPKGCKLFQNFKMFVDKASSLRKSEAWCFTLVGSGLTKKH